MRYEEKDYSKTLSYPRQLFFEKTIIDKVGKVGSLLDIGCCEGETTKKFDSKFKLGLDTYYPNVKKLAEKGIPSIVADAQNISIKNDTFDCIVATEVIEHLPNPKSFLKECYRILKKNGKLVLTTPNKYSIRRYVANLITRRTGNKAHLHTYTHDELNALLQEQGFSNLFFFPTTVEWYWHEYLPFGRFIDKLEHPFKKVLSKKFIKISDRVCCIAYKT